MAFLDESVQFILVRQEIESDNPASDNQGEPGSDNFPDFNLVLDHPSP
jgi:hypothetical protein